MPASVGAFERRGAIGEIFIHPGKNVHEGICTSIWGAPTGESIGRKPAVAGRLHQPSGRRGAHRGRAARPGARVDQDLAARRAGCAACSRSSEIRGQEDPDEFLLVHGHYDSWYEGIGDNATGDAALLELARVLWRPARSAEAQRADRLVAGPFDRTLCRARPGTPTPSPTRSTSTASRSSTSTRPAAPDATAYEEVMWMAEADALCRSSIQDALGLPSQRVRPLRAGDYSFNQIGPTGLYMLLSNIPDEERQRRGYYAVGGCGGNIAWHTPDDLMPVADLEILRRDLTVYLTTIVRILNAPLHPFDYTAPLTEMRRRGCAAIRRPPPARSTFVGPSTTLASATDGARDSGDTTPTAA